MTKQHFIAIAAAFKNSIENARRGSAAEREENAVRHTLRGFCDVAIQFNPAFNQARFLQACGIN